MPVKRTAVVWVNERDLEEAEARMRAHMIELNQSIDMIELSFAPSAAQIERLGEKEREAYESALRDDVASYFELRR